MKKLLSLSIFFFLANGIFAQSTTKPAYVTNPTIPAFTVYKAPDSTVFTKENLQKKKPTLLMIFSPECGHCQHETTVLLNNISHFKNAQILMTTWLPYQEMISFYKNYKIAEHPEITMGWDKKGFFLPYYSVQTYPALIAYNKDGKLVKTFSGNIKIEEVWQALE
jgi:thiol-disulfide isomerase/thioredoxin